MKFEIESVTVVNEEGKRVEGTKVTTVGTDMRTTVIFPVRLSKEEAAARMKKYISNPPAVTGLAKSRRSFKRFNWKDPKKLVRAAIDTKTPFIKIGEVPLITYISDKEGKRRAYKHETKVMPVLYMHPSKPVGLLLGGSLKVREWLED